MLAALLPPSPSLAQPAPDDVLGPALAAVEDLRYQDAIDLLEVVLARNGLGADQRNRALELEAACRLYLGDREAALAGFAALTRRDPGWTLAGDYPPRVQALFEDAVALALAPVDVALEPVESLGLSGVAVRVTEGADVVQEVELVYRLPGGAEVREPFVDVGYVLQAPLPASLVVAGVRVPYTIEARAPSGHVFGTVTGEWYPPELSPAPPPPPPPSPPEPTPWYESWWFWTIVGAAVAGGATAAAVVLTYEPGGPRDGSAGSWAVW